MPLIWMYLTYFTMLAVNILANLLPLNGMTTGEISDRYAALFTPAGYVFSIWGLIYLLLLLWLIGASMNYRKLDKKLMTTISISNLLNAAWIFAWHFSLIFFIAHHYVCHFTITYSHLHWSKTTCTKTALALAIFRLSRLDFRRDFCKYQLFPCCT